MGSQGWRGARTRPGWRSWDAGESASRGRGFLSAVGGDLPPPPLGRSPACPHLLAGAEPTRLTFILPSGGRRVRGGRDAQRPPHGGHRPSEFEGAVTGRGQDALYPPAKSGRSDDALLGQRPLAALRERRLGGPRSSRSPGPTKDLDRLQAPARNPTRWGWGRFPGSSLLYYESPNPTPWPSRDDGAKSAVAAASFRRSGVDRLQHL